MLWDANVLPPRMRVKIKHKCSLSEIPNMCQVSPDSAEAQQQPDSAFVACGKWRPLTDMVFI